MGATHALEVLHALMRVYEQSGPQHVFQAGDTLPFPHLHQRLQQTIRGVGLVALAGVGLPLVALFLLPKSQFVFPGLIAFASLWTLLVLLSLCQILLRYVMVPSPRPFLTDRSEIQGFVQTVVCGVFDIAARVYQEPQLLVLVTWCALNTWLWKYSFFAVLADSGELVSANFSTFALVGGLVAFASFLTVEKSLGEDPFVLDPRAALFGQLQRDLVRALRRGFIVWMLSHLVIALSQGGAGIFSFSITAAYFHIVSTAIESFVTLSTATAFRILLFRATYQALESAAANGQLWDSLEARKVSNGNQSIGDLFSGKLAISSSANVSLQEQYLLALKTRIDGAVKQISSRKVQASAVPLDHVATLEAQFKFANLLVASKFNPATRQLLFSSEQRWISFFQVATAVLDSFSFSLQLLNAIPERKGRSQDNELEKSLPSLFKFLTAKKDLHPLLLLDQYPSLANLRIPSAGFKSKVQYHIDSVIQFAVRRFLVEEARHRVFMHSKVCSSVIYCRMIDADQLIMMAGRVHLPRGALPLGRRLPR